MRGLTVTANGWNREREKEHIQCATNYQKNEPTTHYKSEKSTHEQKKRNIDYILLAPYDYVYTNESRDIYR